MRKKLSKSLAIVLSVMMLVASVPLTGLVGVDISGAIHAFEASAAAQTYKDTLNLYQKKQ